jgi:hypothetical protein
MWQDTWSLSKIQKMPIPLLRTIFFSLIILLLMLESSYSFQREANPELFKYGPLSTWIVFFFEGMYIVGLSMILYSTSNRYFPFIQCSHRREYQFLKTMPLRGESIILSKLIYLFAVMIVSYFLLTLVFATLFPIINGRYEFVSIGLLFFTFIGIHLFLFGPFLYLELRCSIHTAWLAISFLIVTSALLATTQTIFEVSYTQQIIKWVQTRQIGPLSLFFFIGLVSLIGWFLWISSKMNGNSPINTIKGEKR